MKSENNGSKISNSFLIFLDPSNINAHNYPEKEFDIQGYVDQKIGTGETNITIKPEQYRVKPTIEAQKIKLL